VDSDDDIVHDRRAGLLITNRDIVSEDIEDFEYTPRKGTKDRSQLFNEADEVCHLLVDSSPFDR